MSDTSSGIPAGHPSTTTPRAGPCDSPQVVSLKMRPKVLAMVRTCLLVTCVVRGSRCASDLLRTDQVLEIGLRIPEPMAIESIVVRPRSLEADVLVHALRA